MQHSTHPYPFYNPYKKSHLAFLIQNNTISSESGSLNDDDDNIPHENMYLFSDVDLYYQPLLNPIISLALVLPIQLVFVVSAIFIQIRTLQMLKQEKSVNNAMMVTQAKIHILYWPLGCVAIILTENIYPLAVITTPIFCSVFRFFLYFCMFSFILYSFYAALLRYLCCLHTNKVNEFGKDKLITIIYWVFYLHTFVWTLYTIFTSFSLDHLPFINNCYGDHHNIFLMESTPLNMARRHFCALDTGKGKSTQLTCLNPCQNINYICEISTIITKEIYSFSLASANLFL